MKSSGVREPHPPPGDTVFEDDDVLLGRRDGSGERRFGRTPPVDREDADLPSGGASSSGERVFVPEAASEFYFAGVEPAPHPLQVVQVMDRCVAGALRWLGERERLSFLFNRTKKNSRKFFHARTLILSNLLNVQVYCISILIFAKYSFFYVAAKDVRE